MCFKRHIRHFIGAIVLFVGVQMNAQTFIGMGVNVMNTVGEFDKYVPSSPTGVSFYGLGQIKESPFFIGAELGVAMYSGESYMEEVVFEGQAHIVEVFEEECFFHYSGLARLAPWHELEVSPFVSFSAGGTSFFSTIMSTESGETEEGKEQIFQDQTSFHGTAFHTGIGGGFLWNFSETFGWSTIVALDASCSYRLGTRANYRNMGLSDAYVGDLSKGSYTSQTDNINYRIGFAFVL